jgi:hypothetical protein
MKRVVFLLFVWIFFFLISNISAEQNGTMTVEANILVPELPADTISIEVPNYLFMDDVMIGESTDEFQIYVNNTGNVDVTITPMLQDPNDPIFSNIYFQSRKTGNYSQEYIIGDYKFDILKPSISGEKRREYFWMWLDLTNFEENIGENIIGRRADIIFVALPKIN